MAKPRLHAPEAQPVTFVELFFDLVFVFAVTQVTALTAHHLDAAGVARSVLLFWLIWWAWTQFTWTLNPADTQHTIVRAMTLVATGAAFVMAASVPRAFEEDPLWFVVPYVVIRAVGIGLQLRVDQERSSSGARISMTWVYLSLVGLVVVIVGALVQPPARTWMWLGVLAIDLLAAGLASRHALWDLDPRHFSERHGLFVIIALGESLIVAGSAVAEEERTAALVWAAGTALAVACLLWWTYFGWLKEAMEAGFAEAPGHQLGALARDAYSLAHFPLICGIIGFAVAVEEIALHPDRAAEVTVIASLILGISLFVGASALAYWRTTRRVLGARLGIVAITLASAAFMADANPAWPLGIVALGLLTVVVVEAVTALATSPFPCRGRIQRGIVGITADLLHGTHAAGFLTAGDMKSSSQPSRRHGTAPSEEDHPEVLVLVIGQAAFHEAAHHLGVTVRKVPVAMTDGARFNLRCPSTILHARGRTLLAASSRCPSSSVIGTRSRRSSGQWPVGATRASSESGPQARSW